MIADIDFWGLKFICERRDRQGQAGLDPESWAWEAERVSWSHERKGKNKLLVGTVKVVKENAHKIIQSVMAKWTHSRSQFRSKFIGRILLRKPRWGFRVGFG